MEQTEVTQLKRKKKTSIWLPIAIMAVLIIAIVAGVIVYSNSPAQRLKKQLSLGNQYLSELKYEEAVAAFTAALEIDPKDPEAKEALVGTYLAWADALIEQGNTEKAIVILQEGFERTGDPGLSEKIATLQASTPVIKEETSASAAETGPVQPEEMIMFDWDPADWTVNGLKMTDGPDIQTVMDSYRSYGVAEEGFWENTGFPYIKLQNDWTVTKNTEKDWLSFLSPWIGNKSYGPITYHRMNCKAGIDVGHIYVFPSIFDDFNLEGFPAKSTSFQEADDAFHLEEIMEKGTEIHDEYSEKMLGSYQIGSNLGQVRLNLFPSEENQIYTIMISRDEEQICDLSVTVFPETKEVRSLDYYVY